MIRWIDATLAWRGNEGKDQRGIGISLFCQPRFLQLRPCLLIQSG